MEIDVMRRGAGRLERMKAADAHLVLHLAE